MKTFLHQEQFVFILLIVRGRADPGRSDFPSTGGPSAGLRAVKMDRNFLSESMQFVTLARSENKGERAFGHPEVLAGGASFGKPPRGGRRKFPL